MGTRLVNRAIGPRRSDLPQQRVEKKLEGAVGLGSILGAEPNQDHPALSLFGHHHPRLLGDVLLPDEPAALEKIAVAIWVPPISVAWRIIVRVFLFMESSRTGTIIEWGIGETEGHVSATPDSQASTMERGRVR